MSALEMTCRDDQWVCNLVLDRTGNQTAANLADWLLGRPAAVVGLVLLGMLVRWLVHRLIDRVARRAEEGVLPERVARLGLGTRSDQIGSSSTPENQSRRVQRARTMGSMLRSISTGVIVAVVGTMILGELGVNIAPILASAGIIGVALGFGAQSLVKDFLSGIFMIFEDQYGVGDVVDLGEATGTIEAVSLRVTRLRDTNGTVWYVRNGEIVRVGNMSQNWSRSVLDVAVDYSEDLVKVRRILKEVAHDLWDDEDFKGVIIEEPEVWGVEAISPDSVTVRVTLKTAPMAQWNVARVMRERIKARFDFEHIKTPVQRRVVWNHEEAAPAPGRKDSE